MSAIPATPSTVRFESLGLKQEIIDTLTKLGYQEPSPIQAQTIPALLENRDVLGQAQTGTGKTAAFALPILAKLNTRSLQPQALVLVPTRELAIQVTAAFVKYAEHLPDFRAVAVYGGQGFGDQLRSLRNGVHVVVGTPGRIMDHMRRKSLDISAIDYLVLDEADEMLRMGFAEDVQWILQHTPAARQTALFSATMPKEILTIAKNYMRDFVEVVIPKEKGNEFNIRQRYLLVDGKQKQSALERVLETEHFDAMIIFVRTKMASAALADYLKIKGYAAAALNGDVAQNQREKTIAQLKSGVINIIVATDVAARGLDVTRVTHVINYDVPHDIEAYIHRIGRTGRAGRKGDTILFLTHREQRMMFVIEKATKQAIEQFHLPSIKDINGFRITRFKQKISDTIRDQDLSGITEIIKQYQQEHQTDLLTIAAALAEMAQRNQSLVSKKSEEDIRSFKAEDNSRSFTHRGAPKPRSSRRGSYNERSSSGRTYKSRDSENNKTYDDSSSERRSYRGKPAANRPYRSKDAENETRSDKPFGNRPYRGKAADNQTYRDKDSGKRPYKGKAFGNKPYTGKSSEGRSSADQAYEKPSSKGRSFKNASYKSRSADDRKSEPAKPGAKFKFTAKKSWHGKPKNKSKGSGKTY